MRILEAKLLFKNKSILYFLTNCFIIDLSKARLHTEKMSLQGKSLMVHF